MDEKQADYERRILAALEPAEAGRVEARGVLSDEQRAALNAEPAGTITTAPDPVDALVNAAEAAILRLEWASGILIVEENRAETWQLAQDLRAAIAAYRGDSK